MIYIFSYLIFYCLISFISVKDDATYELFTYFFVIKDRNVIILDKSAIAKSLR